MYQLYFSKKKIDGDINNGGFFMRTEVVTV